MKKRINIILFFILNFLVILLAKRYLELQQPYENVLCFGIFAFLSNTILFIGFERFKDLLNPISVYYPFLLCFSYCFIVLSSKQIPLSPTTYIILGGSIFSYVFSVFLYKTKSNSNRIKKLYFNRLTVFYGIIVIAFITFIGETILLGYLPIFNIQNDDVYGDSNKNMIPLFHYFIIMLAFIPAFGYGLYKQGFLSKKRFKVICFIVLCILVNYLSKQVYLMSFMSILCVYVLYNNLNIKKITIYVSLLVGLFVGIAQLRFASEKNIDIDAYYRMHAGINNDAITFYEAAMTEYSSNRFGALEKMVDFFETSDFVGFGLYTFKPLHSFFFLEKGGIVSKPPELEAEIKVGTYVVDPYLDFGLGGVIILNLFYGFLASRYYFLMKEGSLSATIKFSFVSFCMIMGMFVNFFNTVTFLFVLVFSDMIFGNLMFKKGNEK
ncbi:O-antigen polymerase [Myroides marinus]|uniref:O-antigen polymerase n=1 Tax=Myroides marinus TaxID=703342 RepID=UPI002577EB7E|nr:O-antigen polymerase [Myroides marinus]MDM1373364.1 oligosaccharide repeat unit polymerase [Myroides marinus]